jgi:hypothetical protein
MVELDRQKRGFVRLCKYVLAVWFWMQENSWTDGEEEEMPKVSACTEFCGFVWKRKILTNLSLPCCRREAGGDGDKGAGAGMDADVDGIGWTRL